MRPPGQTLQIGSDTTAHIKSAETVLATIYFGTYLAWMARVTWTEAPDALRTEAVVHFGQLGGYFDSDEPAFEAGKNLDDVFKEAVARDELLAELLEEEKRANFGDQLGAPFESDELAFQAAKKLDGVLDEAGARPEVPAELSDSGKGEILAVVAVGVHSKQLSRPLATTPEDQQHRLFLTRDTPCGLSVFFSSFTSEAVTTVLPSRTSRNGFFWTSSPKASSTR
ncbi:hypothetical protein CF327_g1492 [Tilletia walkeri]|uniref:Uncharacterized protein n=1 Tax=Tilletia walkeri TaxID=117179 RepID=A0A8X7NCH0_9BASI|nr:hypothetical protein CF327_g1492 [Tilletia walkeri]KAE8270503.1 hypothetical protein A4X09_0g1854 [Tilletia walkeri]